VYVPVLGVTDFSYAAEFGLISFIAATDHLHVINGPALTPDIYVAQILPYVAIGLSLSLSIHSFAHTHYLKQTSQITNKCSKTERRYVISLHSCHPTIIYIDSLNPTTKFDIKKWCSNCVCVLCTDLRTNREISPYITLTDWFLLTEVNSVYFAVRTDTKQAMFCI
jgi:hypothetical protein